MPVQFKDYYETLGVARTATHDEIQRAYRKLARKYHPDVSKEKGAEAKFKEVNEAYQVLGDEEKRKKYDTLGADWKSGQEFRPPPGWNGQQRYEFRTGPESGGEGFDFGPGGFSDFFEMFFGRGRGGAGAAGHAGRRGGGGPAFEEMFGQGAPGAGAAGQTHEAELTISLEDAYRGATRQITLRGVEGNGQKTFDVRIPAGTTEGSAIRLAGQGGKGPGGHAGDLLLRIHLAPDPRFDVAGHDLAATLPVSPWEAALGAKVAVPTLDGQVTVTVPPGSQSAQKLRLRGKGLPQRGGTHGDLLVSLKIVVPKTLTDTERRLLEELKKESKFDPRGG